MPSVTKIRRGTTAGWTKLESSGKYLENGQLGYNKDTKELKIGTGATPFADLPNIMAGVDPNIYKSTGIFFPSGSSTIQVNGSGASSEAEPLTINLSNPVGSSIYASFKFGKDSGSTMSKFYDANSTIDSPAGTLGTAANPWYGFWGDWCTVNHIAARNATFISFKNDISFFGSGAKSISGYNVVVKSGNAQVNVGEDGNPLICISADVSKYGVWFRPSGAVHPAGPSDASDTSYSATLGQDSQPWTAVYTKEVRMGDMVMQYNSDEEAIEFLAE